MTEAAAPFIIGWEEWVALPGLGLPAIKAKVDTGAKTSALHAFLIEPFGPAAQPMVRFGIHPIPGRVDIEVLCSAAVVDRREVTSSNGEKETRYFIGATIEMGGRSWPIEIGLANRESMAYRMLLGRQAIRDDMMIDPAASFRQPRLSYRLYRHLPKQEPVRRTLRVAVVASQPEATSNLTLAAAAHARGHVVEVLDLARLKLGFSPEGGGLRLDQLLHDGEPLAHYDAVIPRIGVAEGLRGGAIIRQLEVMGSCAVNSAMAIDLRLNRLATLQALAQADVGSTLLGDSKQAGGRASGDDGGDQSFVRILLVGGVAVAALRSRNGKLSSAGAKRLRSERRVAERAVAALRLDMASVDLTWVGEIPCVQAISAQPALVQVERLTGARVADDIIGLIEARAHAWGRHGAGMG